MKTKTKNKKRVLLLITLITSVLVLSACSQTDVVGKVAKTSFAALLEAAPDLVTEDEVNGGWSLSAPDGTARFIWSKDYYASPVHDVMLEFDATPFINAGLDVSKLPAGAYFDNMIILGTKLGTDELTYDGQSTAIASFDKIVELYRTSIGYHEALDHYGVDLGNGNKFEWAKDMSSNDKDIVFVVDPAIFTDAGVDPSKVEGWVYATVEMKDTAGKTIEAQKFLKPFDIE